MRVSERLARTGTPQPDHDPGRSRSGAPRAGEANHAVTLLDAGMLALAALLAEVSGALTGSASISGFQTLSFMALCFTLLAATNYLMASPGSAIPEHAAHAAAPFLVGVAGVTLALTLAPTLGTNAAALEATRLAVLTAAYVLAGRIAFSWAATSTHAATVSATVDLGAKRLFDAVLASLLLLLTAPLVVLVAVAIKLEDGGPVFYRCRRIGEGGREILMLKFRKMRRDAAGPPLTASNDDRFTTVGRFLSASKLDELPQLWDVLRGRMSLVGPRPEDPAFVAMHPAGFEAILRTKPGVTGLCQLAFTKEGHILDTFDPVQDYTERLLPKKIEIDLLYASRRGLLFDVQILAWTVVAVVLRKDVAVNRQTGELTLRRRRQVDVYRRAS